jgi:hypothetical protein
LMGSHSQRKHDAWHNPLLTGHQSRRRKEVGSTM